MQKINWLLKMAWRDSRRNRGRLILFISSIVLGIAALVAIDSFGENLRTDIGNQAKTLLGADIAISGTKAAESTTLALFDSLSTEMSTRYDFASMVNFPKQEKTRLVQVIALDGGYPYYGKFNTVPEYNEAQFQGGQHALVDKAIFTQFKIKVGDTIDVGEASFKVIGEIISVPGRSSIGSAALPSVYIPMAYLAKTQLVQIGSRVEYSYFLKTPETENPDSIAQFLKPQLEKKLLRAETVASRQAGVSRAFDSMNQFLNLVGFIALLLGCLGVASAVHIYIKDKLSTVAILRCLGVSGRQAFLIYLIQISIMGLIGAILGAILGGLIQQILPIIFQEFLPIENITTAVSYTAMGQGIIIGVVISILFALLPLLGIRKTSPLRTLRASFEESDSRFDPAKMLVYLLIALFVIGFAYLQIGDLIASVIFAVGVFLAFLILVAVAKIVMFLVRRFSPVGWSYVARQGIANLYRPNNQTLILIVTIGLGTAMIATLFFIQGLLLNQVALTGEGEQPNMIVFGIQPEDKNAVATLAKDYELPLLQQVPIVTIRLEKINGKDKKAMKQDSTRKISRWVFNREYRVTYRDTMTDSEKIIKGEWYGDMNDKDPDKIYISLSDRIADAMEAKIGDELTFNVQGVRMKTIVSSVREVDFTRMQTNFFVVFPTGILEEAPQFNVLVSRVPTMEVSAKFQQDLVKQFPTVSAIDISQILESVEDILNKVSFVIQFMAMFSILTGILVLISSVALSKYQRIRESVLLRTLGASRRQILFINALEYFALGALATLTGLLLSFIASFLLAIFVFQITFVPNLWGSLLVFIVITGLTVFIGMFNSREVLNKPPLEVLRSEI